MLQQECPDDRWHGEESAINRGAQRRTNENRCGRVGFQQALDVPFVVKINEALSDGLGPGGAISSDICIRLAAYLLVHVISRMAGYTING
jgi:hypothetical protein